MSVELQKKENPCVNQDCDSCPHKTTCDEEQELFDDDDDEQEEDEW